MADFRSRAFETSRDGLPPAYAARSQRIWPTKWANNDGLKGSAVENILVAINERHWKIFHVNWFVNFRHVGAAIYIFLRSSHGRYSFESFFLAFISSAKI